MDEAYEKIDGKYFIYRPLLLLSTNNEADAKVIELTFKKYNCELTMI